MTTKTFAQMTPQQRADHEAQILADFNQRFPVGSIVWYWVTMPHGPVQETRIQQPFFMLPSCFPDGSNSGHPVTFVKGRRGYVSGWHIHEVDESRRAILKPQIMHQEAAG